MYAVPSHILVECYDGECAASTPVAPVDAGGFDGAAPGIPKRRGPPRPHRQKNQVFDRRRLCAALVARPVGRAEIAAKLAAAQAKNHEWARLRNTYVWDEDNPRDSCDVRREARNGQFDVHIGHLAGACVEKNSEMEAAHRTYKGRVVFLGNSVVDQYHDEATFRDMGSSPATLEAAKAADFSGCLR